MYLKLSLEGCETITPIESFEESLAAVARFPDSSSSLVLYCIKNLYEKIRSLQETGRSQTKLSAALIHLIPYVNLKILEFLMEYVEDIVCSVSKPLQTKLCETLFDTISKNYDYSRKNKCVTWYLKLLQVLKISKTMSDYDPVPQAKM